MRFNQGACRIRVVLVTAGLAAFLLESASRNATAFMVGRAGRRLKDQVTIAEGQD